jgi:alpha-tubulin suppressor-like RCC1 family protein
VRRVISLAFLILPLGCHGDGGVLSPEVLDPGVPVQWSSTSVGDGGSFYVHTCGVTTSGRAYCWGAPGSGMLGYDTTVAFEDHGVARPVPVSGGLTFEMIDVGWKHACGIVPGGDAYCWGDGRHPGYLGDGSNSFSSLPVKVSGGLSFRTISAGSGYTCGLVDGGDAYCWGAGPQSLTPTLVPGNLTYVGVSADGWSACGITASGDAYCWGGLGDRSIHPVAVDADETFVGVSVSEGYVWESQACGLTDTGEAHCWGYLASESPGALTFLALDASQGYACGLLAGGAAHCWGDHHILGSLGEVQGGLSLTSISAGVSHACGVTEGGDAYCWGSNKYGQLGDGTTTPSPAQPVRVANPLR